MAKEIFKVEEVAEVMADFMNGVMNGEKGAYENAVGTLKTRYELSEEQETMVRIALSHLEMLAPHVSDDFDLKGFVGLECNVLFHVIGEDFGILNRRVLGDVTEGN